MPITLCFSEGYCMSQKIEKPILSGQRIKTRKRGKKTTNICILKAYNNFLKKTNY